LKIRGGTTRLTLLPLIGILSGLLALPFFRHVEAVKNQADGRRSASVRDAVKAAKALGREEITLGYRIVEHMAFEDLDRALADYPLVYGSLEEKRTVISGGNSTSLQTYMRFGLVERLTEPHPLFGPIPDHVPEDLRRLRGDEFFIREPASGELNLDGIRVRSGNNLLEKFIVGREYLFFAGSATSADFGGFAFGLSGVFHVSKETGSLTAFRPTDEVAEAFKGALLLSISDVWAAMARRSRPLNAGWAGRSNK
jgi:hypothetical protein